MLSMEIFRFPRSTALIYVLCRPAESANCACVKPRSFLYRHKFDEKTCNKLIISPRLIIAYSDNKSTLKITYYRLTFHSHFQNLTRSTLLARCFCSSVKYTYTPVETPPICGGRFDKKIHLCRWIETFTQHHLYIL